jgi:histidine triad (HIT) family protein
LLLAHERAAMSIEENFLFEVDMENCLFCKIAAGQIPSKIVYQDDDVVAFEDINPQAPHHILIIPRRHIASLSDLTPEDGPVLASICIAAQKVATLLNLQRGYRFVANVGPDAGQAVFHLHFHLLGGRRLHWPPG